MSNERKTTWQPQSVKSATASDTISTTTNESIALKDARKALLTQMKLYPMRNGPIPKREISVGENLNVRKFTPEQVARIMVEMGYEARYSQYNIDHFCEHILLRIQDLEPDLTIDDLKYFLRNPIEPHFYWGIDDNAS